MRRPLARSLALGRPGLFYGPAVRDYLDRVRAADGAGLERGVTDGINAYISGLVSANMLGTSGGVISQAASKIKAHCIMSGVNTMPGCFVPVVGPAPTNFNFVPGDYLRKTGLVGNGTTKYLNTGRAGSDDPRDSRHMAVYATSSPGTVPVNVCIGAQSGVITGACTLYRLTSNGAVHTQLSSYNPVVGPSGLTAIGLIGTNRSSSTGISIRVNGATSNYSSTSQAPTSTVLTVFSSSDPSNYSNDRYSFFSIGESIDLAVLQSLQDQLMATFAAAIP